MNWSFNWPETHLSVKFSCKSVHYFVSNPAYKRTDRQLYKPTRPLFAEVITLVYSEIKELALLSQHLGINIQSTDEWVVKKNAKALILFY